MPEIGLQILNAVCHLTRFQDFPDQHQTADDVANAPGAIRAIGYACMRDAHSVQTKQIAVLSNQDAVLREGVGGLLFIGGSEQIRLGCGRGRGPLRRRR